MEDNIPPNIVSDTEEPQKDNSRLFGISLRGCVALILVLTVCAMSVMQIVVSEPLYSLSLTISSFYFGHQVAARNKNIQ